MENNRSRIRIVSRDDPVTCDIAGSRRPTSLTARYARLAGWSGYHSLCTYSSSLVDSSCSFEQRLANLGHPHTSQLATVTETPKEHTFFDNCEVLARHQIS